MNMPVKLAERPLLTGDRHREPSDGAAAAVQSARPALGLSVRELDGEFASRAQAARTALDGVIVSRVEPMSPAFDADIERGHVLLEINRQPVRSVEDYRRLDGRARPGDVLTLYRLQARAHAAHAADGPHRVTVEPDPDVTARP